MFKIRVCLSGFFVNRSVIETKYTLLNDTFWKPYDANRVALVAVLDAICRKSKRKFGKFDVFGKFPPSVFLCEITIMWCEITRKWCEISRFVH